ncbi:F-box family protein [Dorcoceras hygrometricum]|uniref:F-box family protein n=1 Tax=Dorcoceras hygrometricum TaxID=472368 RepID=A0A2Z7AVQ1_9LAMI|nr:F-box family protein [Dorcoceras hygrometricum]
MVVDLIGIYVMKGPYCTLTMINWFFQALSVIPSGSWRDVARRFTMIRWASPKSLIGGRLNPIVDLIGESTTAYSLKCRFPRETGRSQVPRCQQGKWVYLVTHAMSLFDLREVCMVIGSLATLDLPMVVDLIGIFVLKGPYCTLTMTNWFLQALSVIPRGSWGDVARRFTMIQWNASLPSPTPHGRRLSLPSPPPPPVAAVGLVPTVSTRRFLVAFSSADRRRDRDFSRRPD